MSDVAIISLVDVIISSIMLILKLIEMYSNKIILGGENIYAS